MAAKTGNSIILISLLVCGGVIGVLQYIDSLPPVADAGPDQEGGCRYNSGV